LASRRPQVPARTGTTHYHDQGEPHWQPPEAHRTAFIEVLMPSPGRLLRDGPGCGIPPTSVNGYHTARAALPKAVNRRRSLARSPHTTVRRTRRSVRRAWSTRLGLVDDAGSLSSPRVRARRFAVAKVFVSHSSADTTFVAQVHRWLVDDGHEVFLDQDLGDGIAIRDVWEKRLHERLRRADAVVCMPTAAYVALTWCTAEPVIAQSRGSRLLPIHAESGVRHPLLTELQEITERLPGRI
jgi:TIR domain-containing protein